MEEVKKKEEEALYLQVDERSQGVRQLCDFIIRQRQLLQSVAMEQRSRQIADLITVEIQRLQRPLVTEHLGWNVVEAAVLVIQLLDFILARFQAAQQHVPPSSVQRSSPVPTTQVLQHQIASARQLHIAVRFLAHLLQSFNYQLSIINYQLSNQFKYNNIINKEINSKLQSNQFTFLHQKSKSNESNSFVMYPTVM